MSKKTQSQQVYKTETQLKDEARAKHMAESEAAANQHKTEFQKKRENFWYHYKWQTVAGIIGIVLLIFFVKDMFFREKPDATIVVVTGGYISAEALEGLTTALEEFATDFNGDGNVIVATDSIPLPQFENEATAESEVEMDLTGGQQDMGYAMKLMAVLATGAEPIYLLDEAAHDYLLSIGQEDNPGLNNNIFGDLSVPVGTGNIDHEGAAELDGMKLYLRSSCSDENYYEYCQQFLQSIAANS